SAAQRDPVTDADTAESVKRVIAAGALDGGGWIGGVGRRVDARQEAMTQASAPGSLRVSGCQECPVVELSALRQRAGAVDEGVIRTDLIAVVVQEVDHCIDAHAAWPHREAPVELHVDTRGW